MTTKKRWSGGVAITLAVAAIAGSIQPAASEESERPTPDRSTSIDPASIDSTVLTEGSMFDGFETVLPEGLPSGGGGPLAPPTPSGRQASRGLPPHVFATLPAGTPAYFGSDGATFYVLSSSDLALGEFTLRRIGRDGRVMAERRGLGFAFDVHVESGAVLILASSAIIEVDPVTLATIRSHPIDNPTHLLLIGSEIWVPRHFGWLIIDRATGVQRNGPVPESFGPVVSIPGSAGRVLSESTSELLLLEVSGDELVTVASAPAVEGLVVGSDGTIVTMRSGSTVMDVRSSVDLSVISSTTVPRSRLIGWAASSRAVLLERYGEAFHIIGYSLWPVGASAPSATVQGAHVGANLADGLFIGSALVPSGEGYQLRLGTFAPRIGSTDVEVFDRSLVDRVGLDGDGLHGVTSVTANGVAVPFVVRSTGQLDVDVSVIGDAEGVEFRVSGPLGSDSVVVPVRAAQGMVPVSIRFRRAAAGEMAIEYTTRCGERSTDFRNSFTGQTVVLQLPAYTTCEVMVGHGGRILGGFRDAREILPTYDVFGRRASIETSGPVHLDFLLGAPSGTRPLWVLTGAVGDPPRSASYRIAVRCRSWRQTMTIRSGSAGRFAIPDSAKSCSASVVGRGGALSVRLVRVDAHERETLFSDNGSVPFPSGRSLDGLWLLARFDHDGTDFVAPIVLGAPGARTARRDDAGSVVVHATNGDGAPDRSRRLVLARGGLLPGLPQRGEQLGRSVAIGDFDGDGSVDVAIGAPGARVAGHADAGVVEIVSRVSRARPRVDTLSEALVGMPGEPRNRAGFGSALAVFDHDADGYDDLAVGAPGGAGGGEVTVIFGSPTGLDAARTRLLTRRDLDGRAPRRGDSVGSALAGDQGWLVMGAPAATVASRLRAGVAATLQPDGSVINLRARMRRPGDGFGAAVAIDGGRVLVGAPTHRRSPAIRGGMAFLFDSNRGRGAPFAGLGSDGEDGFGLGSAVDVHDSPLYGMIGIPGAVIPGSRGRGAVMLEFNDGQPLFILAGDAGTARGAPSIGFGASLVEGRRGQLIVGAPGNARTPGAMHVFDGRGDWIVLRAPSPMPGDEFGAAVAG